MFLEELSILNYKNIEQAELCFSPGINCFVGNNGMGKTNLLDAIYYLSFCRSYTNPVDSQVIRHDADVCMIQGKYVTNDDTRIEIYSGLRRRQKKQFKRDKKAYEKLTDHYGLIPLVMISPADNELIAGVSEQRRKFMDMAISQYDKEYLRALVQYNRALQQRNMLLKSEEWDVDLDLLELWDEQLVESGNLIHQKRKAFVEELVPIFNEFYCRVSRSNECVSFAYSSQLSGADFNKRLIQNRQRDTLLGHTTVGVHRDELEMLLEGYPMKKVGSQGQNKTFFVSLKLALFQFLLKRGHAVPILLLDDIFDRLDAHQVEEIVKLVSGPSFGQIFISDTNRESFDKLLERYHDNYRVYSVVDGAVTPMSE